jgi:hypothetical protein
VSYSKRPELEPRKVAGLPGSLIDFSSPRPNEGEGLGGEGGGACRIEFRGEAEEALQITEGQPHTLTARQSPSPPGPHWR